MLYERKKARMRNVGETALLVLAVGAGALVGWPMRLAILLGVLMNAWGVW
jgi:hypothetical protein